MGQLRDSIEILFARLGHWVFRRNKITLVIVLGLTFILLSQVPKLSIDTSNDAFYHPDDPIRVAYDEFRQRFGKDDHIFIGIRPESVFDTAFLSQLADLHEEIEASVPHVNKVTSLINARNTYGQDDELIVEDLIEQIPESADALAALRSTAMSNSFYRNYLLSADGQFTAIDVEPNAVVAGSVSMYGSEAGESGPSETSLKYVSTEEYGEMMDVLHPILERYRDAGLNLYVGGFPVITDTLTREVARTMAELTPLSLLLNVLFLSLMFRRLSGVVYPVFIVVVSLTATAGAMAWLSIPLDLVTAILPTLITVVGVADSVHLLSSYYREYSRNSGDRENAIAHAMGRNGLAILMTSVTTSLGLLSFTVADMAPVANLGLVAAIGITLAFVYTVLLLPALIAIFPMGAPRQASRAPVLADSLLDWVADVSCRNYKVIIGLSAILFVGALAGATQLRLSHNPLTWFPEDSPVRTDAVTIDSAMGGSVPIEVVIDTGQEHGFYDPSVSQRLDDATGAALKLGTPAVTIGNVNGIHTVLKEVNQALHGNDEHYYRIPNSRELTAQELLLFELSEADELRKIVSDDYSTGRLTIMVPFTDAIQIRPVVIKVRQYFEKLFADADVHLTGIGPMLVETVHDLLTTMLKSYGFALVAITGLMILLIGRLKIGLISMAPNLLPIALAMGLMGWMYMPFDFSNMLVGSVAIGLVVDDTIHFLHNLRRNLDRTGDVRRAIRDTLHSTGRAIFITSLVLASGMAIAITADLNSTANFGIITASTIVLALIADFFLVPALMYAVYAKRR